MLELTDSAGTFLTQLLDKSNAEDDQAARFHATPQGLQLGLDSEKETDQTLEHDGRTVLLLDEQVAGMLSDRTLDVQETDEGPALALREQGEGDDGGNEPAPAGA